jgi:hypothetical protein
MDTVPASLMRVLDAFRPCFTAPTFDTFVVLVVGLIARPVSRTVCGMLTAAGMSAVWHHSRAHRFFSSARWDTDVLGTIVIRLITGWLVPVGAPLVVAVDDTMFRRWGRKVHGAYWGYDGSVKAPPNTAKISRGNSFVVAAIVVQLPFLDRPVALPVMMRLWHRGSAPKTVLARRLVHLVANAAPGRLLHMVADGAYACGEMRDLPQQATVTAPMPRHASLWHVHPDVDNPPLLRRRGRPRVVGARIGTPAQLATATPGVAMPATRYGRTATITVHEQRCRWRGVFGSRPVRAILITEPGQKPLALITTDMHSPAVTIIERYASRWSIEVAFYEAKNTTGVGEARNRTINAVERTVPFGLLVQSMVIVWYHLAGHHPSVVADRHGRAPWYTTKTHPSYMDMIGKLRRVLIAAQYLPDLPHQPTRDEIRAVHLAWAQADA